MHDAAPLCLYWEFGEEKCPAKNLCLERLQSKDMLPLVQDGACKVDCPSAAQPSQPPKPAVSAVRAALLLHSPVSKCPVKGIK